MGSQSSTLLQKTTTSEFSKNSIASIMKNITSENCAHIDNSDQNTPPVVDNLEQDLKSLSLTSEEKEGSVAPSFKETHETAGHESSGETTEAEAAMKKTKEPRKRSRSCITDSLQKTIGPLTPMKLRFK